VNGRAKPLYFGWPLPLTVSRHGHSYSLWGLVRPAAGPTQVTVLIAGAHARRFRILKTVRTDSFGRWGLRSSVRAAKWRVRWTSPTGVRYQGPPIGAS